MEERNLAYIYQYNVPKVYSKTVARYNLSIFRLLGCSNQNYPTGWYNNKISYIVWGLIPIDACCCHCWSFAYQIFVSSIHRGYNYDTEDQVGEDCDHTDLARGLLHFALCQQRLWLELCHAALLIMPSQKGKISVSKLWIVPKRKRQAWFLSGHCQSKKYQL